MSDKPVASVRRWAADGPGSTDTDQRAAFGVRRPTRDVDLHAEHVSSDAESVLALIRSIAAIDVPDGLVFLPDGARAEVIRGEEQYSGVRVSLACPLARADVTFHGGTEVHWHLWDAPRRPPGESGWEGAAS